MLKNLFKRAWLSTIRKPSRTIILITILFIMANMMLATIAIKASVATSVDYAKQTLGGIVYLQPDMEALRDQAVEDVQTFEGGGVRRSMRIERPSIPVSKIELLADSEYVKDYTYSISARANGNGFTPVATEEQQMREEMMNNVGPGGEIRTFGAIGAISDMSVLGINSFAFISEVESGDMELVRGEIFDETTDGGAMISYELAQDNDISIGDIIKLDTVEDEIKTIELAVIGIYDITTDSFNANTIYMNPATAAQFATDGGDTELGAESAKYFLTSAENKDAFLAEADAKYPDLKTDLLSLNIDDSAYQQMVGPIESVGSFATTILWIVMIASVAIITLIVTINIKDRRYEMGVLLSLGSTKKNIVGQILLELIIVGIIGFSLSIATSSLLAKGMGSGLLEAQVAMSEQQSEQNFGRGQNAGPFTMGARTIGGGAPTMMSGNLPPSDVEVIDELDVSATPTEYLVLFASGFLILIIALIIPSINILRYQPKTILTGKE